jgi:hypothetical protein
MFTYDVCVCIYVCVWTYTQHFADLESARDAVQRGRHLISEGRCHFRAEFSKHLQRRGVVQVPDSEVMTAAAATATASTIVAVSLLTAKHNDARRALQQSPTSVALPGVEGANFGQQVSFVLFTMRHSKK